MATKCAVGLRASAASQANQLHLCVAERFGERAAVRLLLAATAATTRYAPQAPNSAALLLPASQITLMAVMVTQFPMRLSVYAEQFSDVAAHKVSSGGGT